MNQIAPQSIALIVNGSPVRANITPRTHLADFLRGELLLTGTHLGCEQGVCGACTLLIDGRPQRACLAFAVDCDGTQITTIEGYDNDEIMSALRNAFSTHHALQCGFCTPGMLATARDIVIRLGDVDEKRIREELSGNLCRCTGYVGIVRAIASVCAGRKVAAEGAPVIIAQALVRPRATEYSTPPPIISQRGTGTEIEERFEVSATPEMVWAVLSDLPRVAMCLPGAHIDHIDGDQLHGRLQLSLGPIKTSFAGQATVSFEQDQRRGRISGSGRDGGSGSAASGEARWRVERHGTASVIVVSLTWRLTGTLAQFNRGGLVRDVVRRIAADFATNLEANLAGKAPIRQQSLGVFAVIWAILVGRFRK